MPPPRSAPGSSCKAPPWLRPAGREGQGGGHRRVSPRCPQCPQHQPRDGVNGMGEPEGPARKGRGKREGNVGRGSGVTRGHREHSQPALACSRCRSLPFPAVPGAWITSQGSVRGRSSGAPSGSRSRTSTSRLPPVRRRPSRSWEWGGHSRWEAGMGWEALRDPPQLGSHHSPPALPGPRTWSPAHPSAARPSPGRGQA